MPMASIARSWTADEVRAIPDDTRRYEVIDGELLVTPAPRLELANGPWCSPIVSLHHSAHVTGPISGVCCW